MIEFFKDYFAFFYKRYTWGYTFIGQGISLFNFIGIWSIILGPLVRSYIFIPIAGVLAVFLCIFIGWLMFDKLRLKTKFTEQEGIRDDYWQGKLTPNQKYVYTMLLDCIENPNLVKKYRKKLDKGRLR